MIEISTSTGEVSIDVKSTSPVLLDVQHEPISVKGYAAGMLSRSDVLAMIANAMDQSERFVDVANIAARDALTPNSNLIVYVVDASGDPTALAGKSATYGYNKGAKIWYKLCDGDARAIAADQDNALVYDFDALVSANLGV